MNLSKFKFKYAEDILVISLSAFAFSVGNGLDPSNYQAHISGIAFGFGLAWALKMLIDIAAERKASSMTSTDSSAEQK